MMHVTPDQIIFAIALVALVIAHYRHSKGDNNR